MSKNVGFMFLFSLALIAITGVVVHFYPHHDEVSARQISAVATPQPNQLLHFTPHISEVSRPQDSFNFPIELEKTGPTTNLYSGPNQYPFFCMTQESELGQPLVDNQQGLGIPVFQGTQIIGYSKDCSLPTRLFYFTLTMQDGKYIATRLDENSARSHDSSPLFRIEQGTINRFIYTLVMPISNGEVGERSSHSKWNQKLIYQFNGGSGIGYRQGRQKASRVMTRQAQQLLDGYAVISSSGNKTSYTYNMLLAEDTARRVKQQFTSLYGEPLYTVGIGGSGGGLAQYLIGQNSKGILDGLIPLYSYPDMITQTTYALDCDLLNNYFTFRAQDPKAWRDWERRRQIEGLNAINDFPQKAGFLQPLNQLMAGFVPSFPDGNSECINGYFGLSAFINNPRQGFLRPFFSDEVITQTRWSYWQDLVHIFGKDEQGFGRSTWDNVGVQYGLNALREGHISFDEFIHINHHIGGWKHQADMRQEDIALPLGTRIPIWLTLWGNHNITNASAGPARRHEGSLEAMEQAYRSGQVFIGQINLPIIDARHYLENELDMHHMSASFYSRVRIAQRNGHSKNHVIWVAHKDHNPTTAAFAAMDEWLLRMKRYPQLDAASARPASLQDTCFNNDGSIYAEGSEVFDGQWNKKPQGKCQSRFPMFSTSRIQAGGDWGGDMFKCPLVSIETAIQKGWYLPFDARPHQTLLEQTFPDGVCNYQSRDLGRPTDL
ncbi:DUF6351 family protein [Pseudoalteromonas rubra]|uniref:DUF6351 domain-containing protein n=1 Tax=Pseudoalteromonas rubra TaxID=43658 RepID=A0A5S3X6P3_9GAMM|nr:DUF6351 family protein [Pseudoalteromonas rubra]TMP39714.1 hypothetical protein CWB98_03760 [Pseudoalteromonas rubra]